SPPHGARFAGPLKDGRGGLRRSSLWPPPACDRDPLKKRGSEIMSTPHRLGRRAFLRRSTQAGIGALAPPAVFANASRVLGANDRIVMGILGSGGRGRNVMRKLMEFGCDFPAVCDVYEPNLAAGIEHASPGAKGYSDYRPVLDRNDINAVL